MGDNNIYIYIYIVQLIWIFRKLAEVTLTCIVSMTLRIEELIIFISMMVSMIGSMTFVEYHVTSNI